MKRACRIKKVKRLRSGEVPRVVDLFAGCGGLSLGFQREGFRIAASVELDALAAASHHLNFHGSLEHTSPVRLSKDIPHIEAEELIEEAAPRSRPEEAIDVLIGGPPCQAFARVGRAKLREVYDHPNAFKQDPRGNLYLRYIDYVERLQPVAILMENVPDVINYGGHNIAEETSEVLTSMGYTCRLPLYAAKYGILRYTSGTRTDVLTRVRRRT
jgi:DNA (cytosine-5)-methyltransferase 1